MACCLRLLSNSASIVKWELNVMLTLADDWWLVTQLLIEQLLTLYLQLEHILAYSLALVDWDLKVLINARLSPLQLFYQNTHEYTLWTSGKEPPYRFDWWVFVLRRCLSRDIRLFGSSGRSSAQKETMIRGFQSDLLNICRLFEKATGKHRCGEHQ